MAVPTELAKCPFHQMNLLFTYGDIWSCAARGCTYDVWFSPDDGGWVNTHNEAVVA